MRRILKRHIAAGLHNGGQLERVALGWQRTATGLASCDADLDELLEQLRVIPPVIYQGPPPPVIAPPIIPLRQKFTHVRG
jgi:hypothetical protein